MPLPEEIQNIQQTQKALTPEAFSQGIQKVSSSFSGLFPQRKMISNSQSYQQNQPKMYNNIKDVISSMGTITTPFGGSTKFESFHPGIDIANKIGTSIKAFAPGIVKEVISGLKQGDKGYGNYIVVEDPFGNKHRYSHLSQSFVRVGSPVRAGTNIGTMGTTGSTYSTSGGTGSHLDYRIRTAAGRYLNPYEYLSKFYKQKYG